MWRFGHKRNRRPAARPSLHAFLALGTALAAPVTLAQVPREPPAIFDVPLGGTEEQATAMARARGVLLQASPAYCLPNEYCLHRANIEALPGTEFLSNMWGGRRLADRTEHFAFAFTAPPNDHRIWSAGSDQTFGGTYRPSAAAPLLNDVLAELRRRFGEPVMLFDGGGGRLPQGQLPGVIWWLWDSGGRPVPFNRDCAIALEWGKVGPGGSAAQSRNDAATDPRTFVSARRGNCALAIKATIGQERGLVNSLSVRMVDFQAGHDALFHTTRFVQERRAEANQTRSRQNRPDF